LKSPLTIAKGDSPLFLPDPSQTVEPIIWSRKGSAIPNKGQNKKAKGEVTFFALALDK
jgi:hypothetical protein